MSCYLFIGSSRRVLALLVIVGMVYKAITNSAKTLRDDCLDPMEKDPMNRNWIRISFSFHCQFILLLVSICTLIGRSVDGLLLDMD